MVLLAILVVTGCQDQSHRNVRQLFPGSSPSCGSNESCISIHSCSSLSELLDHPTAEDLKILQEALCGFEGRRNPKVCCPREPTTTVPPTTQPITEPTVPTQPTPEPTEPTTQPTPGGGGEALLPQVCGIPGNANTRIFFGEDAPLGAYPWMALLGFTSRFQEEVVWGCGGSLITERYVLTAAHCTDDEFTFNRDLTVVRLGEHNISTELDCTMSDEGVKRCSPRHEDFTPVDIIPHPTFNSRGSVSDDIALIRLDRAAHITTFVMPVCLPPPDLDMGEFLRGREAQVAGWGVTERGPDTQVLQTVQIPFVSRDECNPHYNNGLLEEQVCFGGDGRRDSCFGDSGGPVVATTPPIGRFFTLLATVSFGQPSCGVPGVPAVYTNVISYRQWILDNLKP